MLKVNCRDGADQAQCGGKSSGPGSGLFIWLSFFLRAASLSLWVSIPQMSLDGEKGILTVSWMNTDMDGWMGGQAWRLETCLTQHLPIANPFTVACQHHKQQDQHNSLSCPALVECTWRGMAQSKLTVRDQSSLKFDEPLADFQVHCPFLPTLQRLIKITLQLNFMDNCYSACQPDLQHPVISIDLCHAKKSLHRGEGTFIFVSSFGACTSTGYCYLIEFIQEVSHNMSFKQIYQPPFDFPEENFDIQADLQTVIITCVLARIPRAFK